MWRPKAAWTVHSRELPSRPHVRWSRSPRWSWLCFRYSTRRFTSIQTWFEMVESEWNSAVVCWGQCWNQPLPRGRHFSLGIQEGSRQQLLVFIFWLNLQECLKEWVLSSVGRQVLTKRSGADDDIGDNDIEDITSLYKSSEGMSRYQKQSDGCFNSFFSTRI